MTTKTVEQLETELAELRGAVREFVDGCKNDLKEAERELYVFYAQIVLGFIGCLIGWTFAAWYWG